MKIIFAKYTITKSNRKKENKLCVITRRKGVDEEIKRREKERKKRNCLVIIALNDIISQFNGSNLFERSRHDITVHQVSGLRDAAIVTPD